MSRLSKTATLDLGASAAAPAAAAAADGLEYQAENDEGGHTWYTKKELMDAGYLEEDLKDMKTRRALDDDGDTEIDEAPAPTKSKSGGRAASAAGAPAKDASASAGAGGAVGGEVSWLFMHDIRKVKTGGKAGKPNYDDLSAWTKYDADTAKIVEAAYEKYLAAVKKQKDEGKGKVPRGVCQVGIKVAKTAYVVCFSDDDGAMRQWRKDDTTLQRPVQRREDADAARPAKSPKKEGKATATLKRTKSAPKPKSETAAAAAVAATPKKSPKSSSKAPPPKRGASGEVKAPAAAAAAAAEPEAPPAKRKRTAAPTADESAAAAAAKASPKATPKSSPKATPKTSPKKLDHDWLFMHDIRFVKDAAGEGKTTHGKPNYNKKDAWTKYSDEIAAKLESAYQVFQKEAKPLKKHTQVGISSAGKDYVVSFKDKDGQMRQWRKDDEYLTRPVQRREKGKRWGA